MKIFGLGTAESLLIGFFPAILFIVAIIVGIVLYRSAKKGDAARRTALAALVMGAASVPEAFFGVNGAMFGLMLGLIACILSQSCRRYPDYAAVKFMMNCALGLAVAGLVFSIFVIAKTGVFAMFFGFDGWFGPSA